MDIMQISPDMLRSAHLTQYYYSSHLANGTKTAGLEIQT